MNNTKFIVHRALVGNVIITVVKYLAALTTGSAAILAEAIHTTSDTLNQTLLLFGINVSEKKHIRKYTFDREREQYFWSFVVALLFFGFAGVLGVVEGIFKFNSIYTIDHPLLLYTVLTFSIIVDGYVLYLSLTTFIQKYRKLGYKTIRLFLAEFRDPVLLTTIVEDLAAIVGVVIATIGILLSILLHNTVYDAVASMLIGIMLMISGLYLAKQSKDLLVGEGLNAADRKIIMDIIKNEKNINALLDMKAEYLSPDSVLLTLDINFKDELTTKEIEDTIDNIERKVKESVPVITHIYIEAEEH